MPLTKFKRGNIWYIRGTVAVGERSKSIYESTKLSDEGQAETFRIRRESRLIDELLHGEKETVTFQHALVSYGASGGSPRFLEPLNDRLADRPLKSITQSDLDALAKEIYPTATADTRNRQCYTPFIAVWNHAVLNGWAEMRKWQRPRKVKGTKVVKLKQRSGSRPVAYDRAATFVAGMSAAPAMVMTALFFTGMRPIELFSLTADEVNVPGRWITLEKTKTGEPRGVPIHEFLLPLFEALADRSEKDGEPALFRTPRGKPYPLLDDGGGQLKTAINGARRRTGIKDISPYTARHSVSTQLVINGVHAYVKDQILGHAVGDMSRRYTSVPQQPLIDAINTLAVPEAWTKLEWLADPVGMQGKLVTWTKNKSNDKREKSA